MWRWAWLQWRGGASSQRGGAESPRWPGAWLMAAGAVQTLAGRGHRVRCAGRRGRYRGGGVAKALAAGGGGAQGPCGALRARAVGWSSAASVRGAGPGDWGSAGRGCWAPAWGRCGVAGGGGRSPGSVRGGRGAHGARGPGPALGVGVRVGVTRVTRGAAALSPCPFPQLLGTSAQRHRRSRRRWWLLRWPAGSPG
jgi:hypothetical protein